MNLLNNDLNPIQAQIIAMIILHMKKPNYKCILQTLDIKEFKWPIDNLNDFHHVFDFLNDFKSGIVIFINDLPSNFQFIYSYENDAVCFTPNIIPENIKKYAYDLFCEAEFIININLLEQWICEYNESIRNTIVST
jgi:hypothetical protein